MVAASAGESNGGPLTTPTIIAPPSPSKVSGVSKPLPPITSTAADEVESPKGDRAAPSSSLNDLRKMSVPDVMKELPPITPEKEHSEVQWGEMVEDESKMYENSESSDSVAATTDSTAVLLAGLAAISVGPVNPDSFAPSKEPERALGDDEKLAEGLKQEETQSGGKELPELPSPPPPPPKDRVYLDTTPMTPLPSAPSSVAGTPPKRSTLEPAFDELTDSPTKKSKDSDDDDDDQSEIQSILEQFEPGHEGHSAGDYPNSTSAAMSRSNSYNMFVASHPPRTSSLEALKELPAPPMVRVQSTTSSHASPSFQPDEKPHQYQSPRPSNAGLDNNLPPTPEDVLPHPSPGNEKELPQQNPTLHKPPPPELDPNLPFDFHRFLEQLRHRTADPVAKYLRSFLLEFSKKQWMVHEQVKIIHDFLHFITGKMSQCEVWREVSDQEFDNAKEGMEKLVMNRLYTQTFSPAIPPANPPTPLGRRRGRNEHFVGRRGQHQEDVERDEVLAQKVRIYGWVREEHLDIKPVGESGRRFLTLAKQELEKIKTYRAPRDKVICVLNCCKVIFGRSPVHLLKKR